MSEPFSFQEDPLLCLKTVVSKSHELYAGFTLRSGGTSQGAFHSMNLGLHVGDHPEHVVANRRIIAGKTGFPLEQWVCAEQVHGIEIAQVDAASAGSGAQALDTVIPGVDGLFTTEPDLLLALCFADCVPIFYYAKDPDVIGIMHAGWRGTVAGAAAQMIEQICRAVSIKPDALHVVIGPSIGADYEVDQQVVDKVKKLRKSLWTPSVRDCGNGHYLLNLKLLNRSILAESGIPERQIQMTGYSTYAHPSLFFSYRHDLGKTGRMMGYIGMKKKEH
ncbi:peptidoglycan editing factor PgeF [Sporolactobacillus inulinus]|uniref:Purine nucleoside phosphorylase n=2 Tax=Sporolactobacillus inulinus TaxID=2078 RepID=A0A4Y1ZC24_9BACL|nr:peptidoglycan editing factor PgeF [Sporolactobacillus inulinus]KLI01784.1 hypothetical protein SINU_11560 [Sporolactobacillus inulinus CASD]GAY76493.1 uncharacterized conserved protein [Sporolactobacillus inulinus]GEB76430.1 laccase domain protein [Sporolactobacillus inulinus]